MDQLPQQILDRVSRLQDFHRLTKYTPAVVRAEGIVLDFANQPNPRRVFPQAPRVPLPTTLLDAPAPALPILVEGLAAVPPSQQNPAQDLRTLATWLFFAAGQTAEFQAGDLKFQLRSCPSMGALYPFELYVAAFGIDGLEPGLYHFSVREFALRRLRDGLETLNMIKRGRPDLSFLKSVPAVMLVSTIFWRSAWRYRRRGYRAALLDSGHLVQNLVTVGNSLGVQTMARLWCNERNMRELIGVPPDAEFGTAESVQAMVVWADGATKPMPLAPVATAPLEPIERQPLSPEVTPYGSITAAHLDCVAPGNPFRLIRPPATNSSAMPDDEPGVEMPAYPPDHASPSVRQTILSRRSTREFERGGIINRYQLLEMTRIAFLTGSYHPILPDGPHIGLLRPFWIVNDVAGMDSGLWLYHPPADRWWMMARGDFRDKLKFLMAEQSPAGNVSAMCIMFANLMYLMSTGGPDTYRLSHIEAGIAGQRLTLAATALELGCRAFGAFYDDEIRFLFGLNKTGWEPIYAIGVGNPAADQGPFQMPALEAGWRGEE